MKILLLIFGLIISSVSFAQPGINEVNIDSAKILLHASGGCIATVHEFIEFKYSRNDSSCIFKHIYPSGISKQSIDPNKFISELTQFNINILDTCIEWDPIRTTGSGGGNISVVLWSENKEVINKEFGYHNSCISGEFSDFRNWIFENVHSNQKKMTFNELVDIYENDSIFIQNYSATNAISVGVKFMNDTSQIESMLRYLVDPSRTKLDRSILICFALNPKMKNKSIVPVVNGLIEKAGPPDSESYFMANSLRNQDNTTQKINTLKLAYNKFTDFKTKFEAASQLASNKIPIGKETLLEGLREKKADDYQAIIHLIQIADDYIIDEVIDIYYSVKSDSTLTKYSHPIDYLIFGLNALLSPNEQNSEYTSVYNYSNREQNMLEVEEKIRKYKSNR